MRTNTMAFKIDDRILWIGFGALLFAAGKAIHYALTDLVRLTEIDPHQYAPEKKREQTEDAIAIDTLRTLIASPDHSISTAATSVAISRMSGNLAVQKLMWQDIDSRDPDVSPRARLAMKYLHHLPPGSEFVFKTEALPMASLANAMNAARGDSNWENAPREPSDSGADAPSVSPPLRPVPVETERDGPWVLPPFTRQPDILFNGESLHESSEVPSVANPIAGWTDVPRAHPATEPETLQEARRRRREAMALVRDPEEEVGTAGER